MKKGILLHISSLPGGDGIGTFGKSAYKFIDFLKEKKQDYWQVLPLGHTGFGDSPYQCFSAFALNPYFLDIEKFGFSSIAGEVNFSTLYLEKYKRLKKCYKKLIENESDFLQFCNNNAHWLEDYSLFMAIKDFYNGASWNLWPDELRLREASALAQARKTLKNRILFYKIIQYGLFCQYQKLKGYANKNGISIIGDMPIYVAFDSSDVWANPKYFRLNKDFQQDEIAAVPPDYFSKAGQRWGNPLYNWQELKSDKFEFWKKRFALIDQLFDAIRIDHFRGFSSFYVAKKNSDTAKEGRWEFALGEELFLQLEKCGLVKGKTSKRGIKVIAEDLGILSDDVYALLNKLGYSGIKVLQFGIGDKSSIHRPENFTKNNDFVYTGTHDNNTTNGWLNTLSKEHKQDVEELTKNIQEFTNSTEKPANHIEKPANHTQQPTEGSTQKTMLQKMIELAYKSKAEAAIIPMQDILGLDASARMNTPGTKSNNWKWRL